MADKRTFTVGKDETKEIEVDAPGTWKVQLNGEGAQANLKGIFDVAGNDTCDVTVIIHHQAANTRADTVLKGVGRDSAKIKFVGRIIIDPDCGNSNSFLTERILLLSDKAVAETVPDLEILTDDVACSHAASITNVSDEHLFYLMSRGIPKDTAQEMIVTGFLEDDF